jgi:hypothetical protein
VSGDVTVRHDGCGGMVGVAAAAGFVESPDRTIALVSVPDYRVACRRCGRWVPFAAVVARVTEARRRGLRTVKVRSSPIAD